VLVLVLIVSLSVNAEVVRYHYSGSSLVASESNDAVRYFHSDRLGSNRLAADSSGNSVESSGVFLSARR